MNSKRIMFKDDFIFYRIATNTQQQIDLSHTHNRAVLLLVDSPQWIQNPELANEIKTASFQ